MNKAIKGNQEEIRYTILLNKKEKFFEDIPYNQNNVFSIHVTKKKYGEINEAKIFPKADIFFATGEIDENYLLEKKHYLTEKDFKALKLTYIDKSGTSIKLPNSRYTITKISPNTFKKIFGSNILGAGASIYCKNQSELKKNINVLKGWGISESEFISFFKKKLNIDTINPNDLNILKSIKTFSNNEIHRIIVEDSAISDLIFKGIGNFKEPFTAHWIIENDEFKPNYYIPFKITTGSGRSKGTFTIVLKPK